MAVRPPRRVSRWFAFAAAMLGSRARRGAVVVMVQAPPGAANGWLGPELFARGGRVVVVVVGRSRDGTVDVPVNLFVSAAPPRRRLSPWAWLLLLPSSCGAVGARDDDDGKGILELQKAASAQAWRLSKKLLVTRGSRIL